MSSPLIFPEEQRSMHRVYVTVSIPLSVDVLSRDGEHAWEIVSLPTTRKVLAQRLCGMPAELLVQKMELQGYSEQLPDTKSGDS